MKKIYGLLSLLAVLVLCGSCNDEWKDEQFERYVSFKAPIDSKIGVTHIYVRYNPDDKTSYKLPLIVSGSTTNDKDMTVHVAVDSDTLRVLNYERFQTREDYYYKELESKYFSIPETVNIKAGENTSLMNINFTLKDIDLVDKWVLPLTILDNPSYDYVANPRKHYKKALLRVIPFNNYSGSYSGTALRIQMEGREGETPIVKSTITAYVVDENTIFFYAGNIDEDRKDRANYKVYARFNDAGGVTLSADAGNTDMNFSVNKDASYVLREEMDAVRPYLLHRYVTINNISYQFTDYTMIPGLEVKYKVEGSLILERKINTQIPDEDQAIEW